MEEHKDKDAVVELISNAIDRRADAAKEFDKQANDAAEELGLPKTLMKPTGNIAIIGDDAQRVSEVMSEALAGLIKKAINGLAMPNSGAVPIVCSPINMDLIPDGSPILSIMIQSFERLISSVFIRCLGDNGDEFSKLEKSWFALQRSAAHYFRTTEQSTYVGGESATIALAEQAQSSFDLPSNMRDLSKRLGSVWLKANRFKERSVVFVVPIDASMGLSSSQERMSLIATSMRLLSDARVVFLVGINKAFVPRRAGSFFVPRNPNVVFDAYDFEVAFSDRIGI